MKVKLLKKVRSKYPIYCLTKTDSKTNDLLSYLFDQWGVVYFTGSNTFNIIAHKAKNDLIDSIISIVRKEWSVRVKGRSQKIIKL
jgi:hypothetical protein